MSNAQRDISEIAREHGPSAIKVLKDIMSDGAEAAKDRISAANSILDRGHGRPTQAVITMPIPKAMRAALAKYTDAELAAAIAEETPISEYERTSAMAIIEAEFEPVPTYDPEDDPLVK